MKKAASSMNQRIADIFWRNVKYYDTIKKLKPLNDEAANYLEKRLRQKGVIGKDAECNAFTGTLMFDFVWSRTPQGMHFWVDLDSKLRKLKSEKTSGS